MKLALELDLDLAEARTVALGGLLHDLGHIALPDTALSKGDSFSAEQSEKHARYPVIGADILAPLPALHSIALLVRAHGEHVDGSGYPGRLKGEAIPLGARIIAVASAYETALAARTRSRHALVAALKEVRREAGTRFDARVVDALEHVLAVAPRPSSIDIS